MMYADPYRYAGLRSAAVLKGTPGVLNAEVTFLDGFRQEGLDGRPGYEGVSLVADGIVKHTHQSERTIREVMGW